MAEVEPGEIARPRGDITLEVALHFGALLVGVLLRLLLLDLRPLSIEEGALAAESHRVWQGQQIELLRQGPLAAHGTALLLAMFGGGDGAVRLLSILFGSAMLAVPYLLRGVLGTGPALLSAYALAVSPLMLFASRDVGSGIVPMTLGLLLWWALEPGVKEMGRWRAYGVGLLVAGLLTSGTEGLSVLLALAAAALLSHPQPAGLLEGLRRASTSHLWRQAAMVFVAGLLAIGTGLGFNLAGVQAVLVDVWVGWVRSFTLAVDRPGLLGLLALYELPVLALAIAQIARTIWRRDRVDTFLSLWALILLLLAMVQGLGIVPRVVLPMLPLYLLAARFLARGLSVGESGRPGGWRWGDALLMLLPVLMATVLLNAASLAGNERFISYLYAGLAAMAVLLGAAWVRLVRQQRGDVVWLAGTMLAGFFLLHTTVFLNFRLESMPREPILAGQASPFLRDAGSDAAYFSNYFKATVTVDPELKAATEWYLRGVQEIRYSTEVSSGISFQGVPANQATLDSGSERRPGVYTPTIDPRGFTWQGVWRWVMGRDGLVRPSQRDIIVRAPVGSW